VRSPQTVAARLSSELRPNLIRCAFRAALARRTRRSEIICFGEGPFMLSRIQYDSLGASSLRTKGDSWMALSDCTTNVMYDRAHRTLAARPQRLDGSLATVARGQ
jgi:hypothetical protein